MDVFYYWKDINEDLKTKRIGYFRSNLDRLKEFQDGSPDLIWVFKTPRGLKGQVQLHASLRWTDSPVGPVLRRAGESYMYYDPMHPDSAMFTDSSTPGAIDEATAWVKHHFPSAITGNFQGLNGQHAMRGAAVGELRRMASSLAREPFPALK